MRICNTQSHGSKPTTEDWVPPVDDWCEFYNLGALLTNNNIGLTYLAAIWGDLDDLHRNCTEMDGRTQWNTGDSTWELR